MSVHEDAVRRAAIARKFAEFDSLEVAQDLVTKFARLEEEREVVGGARDQLNDHLEGCYRLIFYFHNNSKAYDVFRAHEYFSDVRQKPRQDTIALSVLKFTMRAKNNEVRLNRAYKRAAVLEHFCSQDVVPDGFAKLLKDVGGVDHIYELLCAQKTIRRNRFVSESGTSTLGQQTGSAGQAGLTTAPPGGMLPSAQRALTPDAEMHARSILLHRDATFNHGSSGADAASPTAHAPVGPERPSGEPRSPTKKGALNRADLKTELIVELIPSDLEEILASGGGTLKLVVHPADERDWKPVTGRVFQLQPRNGV